MRRRFAQVDVFAPRPYAGNPLAVVADAEGVTADEMQRFASWTNLSETTFLLPPTQAGADYRVRIFTPFDELPFAGHPTLGSCRVWLDHGGVPFDPTRVVQECGIGLVTLRLDGGRVAFAAPPQVRSGEPDAATIEQVTRFLRADDVVACRWIDNGPGWLGVLLHDADAVLALRPDASEIAGLDVGVAGPHPAGAPFAFELRAFFPTSGGMAEDPVTGSLNASMAQWLMERDPSLTGYLARQGTALGRDGHIHVARDADTIWIGGDVVTCVTGTVEL